MSRHAPTLFVGLGGSGVKVLRWLRQAIFAGLPQADQDREPVAFLGIDFDPSSNRATDTLAPLGATEFRYYDPSSVASTVNNIDRERASDQNTSAADTEHWEFPEIREWYPDPEQKSIRYAQTEATGAAQWRPLGRVGYFLNDREIHDAIGEALTELDRRRGWSVQLGDQPTVIIVSSIAGGTGSSILFDVAVAIRKIRRGVPVRAFLMLPELFDQIDFRDRVFPNAYATLWEVAALKNQHVVFNARYPRTPPVTRSDSPPPFQRVFLIGPWIGERKPFSEPDDVFPFVAQLLRMSITPEIRAAALTAEANASADSGAPLSDPTSLHVFCAMSAMAIRLLSYAELADLVMRQFLHELKPEGQRPLLDALSPGRMTSDPIRPILDWIETAASGRDEAFAITPTYRELELAKFMRTHDAYRTLWRASDLEKLKRGLRRFCGTDPSTPMEEPPELLNKIRNEFAERLQERIVELSEQYGDYPRALEGFLTRFERQLPELRSRKPLPDLQNIDNLEQWLNAGGAWGSLAQQLTPGRLERVHDEARRWFNNKPGEQDYRLWLRQAIGNAARDVVRRLREAEESRWQNVDKVREAALPLLATSTDPIEARNEQIFLDGRNADATRVLEHELARFDPARAKAFHRELMADFLSFYEEYRMAGDASVIRRWIAATRKLFERVLAAVPPEDTETKGESYRLVAPESLFTEREVTSALLRCRTRVFQPGRVSTPAALRIARLLVPDGFRGRAAYYTKMRNWSKGLLNAATSSLQANGSGEDRIVVVVEDLFHPAEDIVGIYDYHSHYAGQDNRLLFHIHRQWPASFPPLITRAGDRSRVPCGNPHCEADIRTLPHTALFCPVCAEPIRNRCGNRDCLANDLGDRPNRAQFIESKTCPVCRGFLKTSWWKCSDHGDVPMDKPNCPYCVRSGRPAHRVSVRPDRLDRFTCPTCTSRNLSPRFSATGDVARFLVDGVDGHDLLHAQAELGTVLNRGAFCPRCAAQLAPVCPLQDGDHPERPHYLYRHRERGTVDRFRCYLHTDAVFYTCSHCQFPMLASETRCARCASELTDCRFCTPVFGVRIPADGAGDRCPNCFTRPLLPAITSEPTVLRDATPDERFCSNLFGCPAGGHLNDATFPSHTEECPFCRSHELPLLQAYTRKDHLQACRYCTTLFGLNDVPNRAEYRGSVGTNDGRCCLCGQEYAGVDKSEYALDIRVKIGCVLRCTTNDEEAFRLLLDRLKPLERHPLKAHLGEFLKGITREPVKRVVEERLQRILSFYDRQFGCRSGARKHAEGTCAC